MKTITNNEMKAMLTLFKDFSVSYNANSLSKRINLTPMGALKILKSLEKQNVLKSKKMGKAVFYKPNFDNDHTKTYLKFLLQKESEQPILRIKRWVKELGRLQSTAEIGILFGSVLKTDDYKDVDLLLVLKQSQNKEVNRLIADINRINVKNVHVVKQLKDDLKKNLEKKDKILLDIIKNGIVLFGYTQIIEAIGNVTH